MAFAQQLLTGLTRRDIEDETGRNELAFVGPKGVAAQYRFRAQANAGLGVVAALESRVGDVVGFFLHTALHDEASTYLAQAYHALGDYRRALDLLRTSVAALDSDRLRRRIDTGSLAPVFSRTVMALCLAEVGAFPEGTARAAEGLQIAEGGDPPQPMLVA